MLQLLRGAASQRHSLALHRESTDRRKATEREAEQVKFNTRHPQFQAQSLFKDYFVSAFIYRLGARGGESEAELILKFVFGPKTLTMENPWGPSLIQRSCSGFTVLYTRKRESVSAWFFHKSTEKSFIKVVL
jgi:hypothetical protein